MGYKWYNCIHGDASIYGLFDPHPLIQICMYLYTVHICSWKKYFLKKELVSARIGNLLICVEVGHCTGGLYRLSSIKSMSSLCNHKIDFLHGDLSLT